MNRTDTAGCALALTMVGLTAHAQIEVVIAEGDPAPGTAGLIVGNLNAPFTTSDGRVGFTGSVTGTNFVWFDDGVVWLNSDALPTVLGGAESTMGISDAGGFIYSPSVDGDDAVWGHNGLILREPDPAPEIPGQFIAFCSRPTMLPDGTAHWVSGLSPTKGGSSLNRVLYRASPAGDITKVIASGDPIDGFTVSSGSGVSFDYDFSDDGAHSILTLRLDGFGTINDDVIAVDGIIVARENFPTGSGDNWDNFDSVSVNDHGQHVFGGDTDGAATVDEFIAVDGSIVIRQGDEVGCTILDGGAVLGLSINDDGVVVHAWDLTGDDEILFVGRADALAATSRIVLRIGDAVDVDGDGTDDALVTNLNASNVVGPGYELAEDGFVYAGADVAPLDGGDEFEVMLRVGLPDFDCPADFNGDGVVTFADILILLQAWGPCPGCPLDLDGDCAVAFTDLVILLSEWGLCDEG